MQFLRRPGGSPARPPDTLDLDAVVHGAPRRQALLRPAAQPVAGEHAHMPPAIPQPLGEITEEPGTDNVVRVEEMIE